MYQAQDFTSGGGGAVALRADPIFTRQTIRRGFGSRADASLRPLPFELLADLGTNIGSRAWWRGLGTCTALCGAALLLAPGFEPVAGASAPKLSSAELDEARALAIAPIAYGSDTGRRMAPGELVEALPDIPERPRIDLVANLGAGDGFAAALQRAGVAGQEAQRVAAMVGGVVPLADLKPGTAMQVTLGRRATRTVARPLDHLSFRARFDLQLQVVRANGQLALKPMPIAVDNTPLRIQGLVGSSLYRAARAAGAPAKAVESYLRALATQLNVGAINADDRFDIIVEHRRAATGEAETGKLLYAGLNRSGAKDLQLLQWSQEGRAQWFEASGVGKTSGALTRPVPGTVSSAFGMRRHPILGFSRMHKGMDFRAGWGTPILAATDGRVTRAGWAGGYGKQVRLSHAGGLATSYSHMSRIVAQPGQAVRQGQVIGYVGSTGLSTGPHLHYELYSNGTPINPASVKFVMRAQLAGNELAAFRGRLQQLLSVPVGAARAKVQQAANTAKAPTRS